MELKQKSFFEGKDLNNGNDSNFAIINIKY